MNTLDIDDSTDQQLSVNAIPARNYTTVKGISSPFNQSKSALISDVNLQYLAFPVTTCTYLTTLISPFPTARSILPFPTFSS